jgi:hypothetical protein
MTRRFPILLVVIVVAMTGALLWYVFGERRVPEGQPPLAALGPATLDTLRADFNREADATRVIVLLSPT